MIKHGVFNCLTGAVQFTAEIDCDESAPLSLKLGLAVDWGVKNGASLNRANLNRASLDWARLSGASLKGASRRGSLMIRNILTDLLAMGLIVTFTCCTLFLGWADPRSQIWRVA